MLEVATAAAAAAVGDAAPPADTPQIAVSVGIVVALGASWLSSLGERLHGSDSTSLVLT